MSAKDTGGSAYPRPAYGFTPPEPGASLRDRFAMEALHGAISGHISYYGHESNHWQAKDIASYAYDVADAMLEARKQ